MMRFDPDSCYAAYSAREARFDGLFYLGVTTTGIYCRPICPARVPKREHCRFFAQAAEAEKAGFRPCLRCRPEMAPGTGAPGTGPAEATEQLVAALAEQLESLPGEAAGRLERLAEEAGISARHIRRLFASAYGVSPLEWLQTRRLLLAKQLLTDTRLPVTEVAFASGFGSLRRFNDAFLRHYGLAPSHWRNKQPLAGRPELCLRLAYRPPYDWAGLLEFLRHRQLPGVEWVTEDSYARTLHLHGCTGWVRVRQAEGMHALSIEPSPSLLPVLPALLMRLRHLFDLHARPDLIAERLGGDAMLAACLQARPGLRVPGACDGFELGLHAILGQQVSVRAATTLAGRLSQAFGETIDTGMTELRFLSPTAERLAATPPAAIAALGLPVSRAQSIVALAGAVASGRLRLEPGAAPEATIRQLTALPGIGEWTATYIAMRSLRWPDAFLHGDLGIRKALGGISAAEARQLSARWQPWRSYATLHLWQSSTP